LEDDAMMVYGYTVSFYKLAIVNDIDFSPARQKLAEQINQTLGKDKVLQLTSALLAEPTAGTDLLALTFHPKKEIAFRAAWILENLFLADVFSYVNNIDELVANLPLVKNESSLRHYFKILIQLTDKRIDKQIAQKISAMDMEPVISRCFDLLIDEDSPIALKVFAMELLYNLRHREDWITETLIGQIQLLMEDGGPGIRARGRDVLRKLMR
jgi:hypothetical protein